ncbi:kinesin motor domain-containing protein [Artemisia annua]|uniref:Kinesin motor domain-containing protein n=1 Tax=Artemisia annua TaxID=35608 RepID=A0A2U1QPJ9_ARTAN|nr:kinesin motor domain-containing protein [Artemisia annua]
MKSQKVQLQQQKVKQEDELFWQWKANHEKQLMQVKKDSRKNEFELNKLNALYKTKHKLFKGNHKELQELLKS